MRVAIAGAGNVGLFIANDLAGTGHEVQLVEQNPSVAERLALAEGVELVVADACEVTSLRTRGLRDAAMSLSRRQVTTKTIW